MSITHTRLSSVAQAVCLFVCFLSLPALAFTDEERSRASSLFVTYKEAMLANNREAAEKAITTLISELPSAAAAVVHKEILTETEALARIYARNAGTSLDRDESRRLLRDSQVLKDRALLAEIYAIKDDATQKKRLAEEGWPAIERLRAKLLPDPNERLDGIAGLRQRREEILFRLGLCDILAARSGLPRDTIVREQIELTTGDDAGLMSIATAKDKRVLAANRKIAGKGTVPDVDLLGAEEGNRIRMLAGLPALLIDPALCKAALTHSTDMFVHQFFSHNSPVEGRRAFTDRAKEAGTTASAENICRGQQDTMEANRDWFHSPGHFMNFFGNSARIGFGTHEKHYTQLFGN